MHNRDLDNLLQDIENLEAEERNERPRKNFCLPEDKLNETHSNNVSNQQNVQHSLLMTRNSIVTDLLRELDLCDNSVVNYAAPLLLNRHNSQQQNPHAEGLNGRFRDCDVLLALDVDSYAATKKNSLQMAPSHLDLLLELDRSTYERCYDANDERSFLRGLASLAAAAAVHNSSHNISLSGGQQAPGHFLAYRQQQNQGAQQRDEDVDIDSLIKQIDEEVEHQAKHELQQHEQQLVLLKQQHYWQASQKRHVQSPSGRSQGAQEGSNLGQAEANNEYSEEDAGQRRYGMHHTAQATDDAPPEDTLEYAYSGNSSVLLPDGAYYNSYSNNRREPY